MNGIESDGNWARGGKQGINLPILDDERKSENQELVIKWDVKGNGKEAYQLRK